MLRNLADVRARSRLPLMWLGTAAEVQADRRSGGRAPGTGGCAGLRVAHRSYRRWVLSGGLRLVFTALAGYMGRETKLRALVGLDADTGEIRDCAIGA